VLSEEESSYSCVEGGRRSSSSTTFFSIMRYDITFRAGRIRLLLTVGLILRMATSLCLKPTLALNLFLVLIGPHSCAFLAASGLTSPRSSPFPVPFALDSLTRIHGSRTRSHHRKQAVYRKCLLLWLPSLCTADKVLSNFL
jgi:hypothetical protein